MTVSGYTYIVSSPTLFNIYKFEEKLLLMMLALKIVNLQKCPNTVNTVIHLKPSLTSISRGASPFLHSLIPT